MSNLISVTMQTVYCNMIIRKKKLMLFKFFALYKHKNIKPGLL